MRPVAMVLRPGLLAVAAISVGAGSVQAQEAAEQQWKTPRLAGHSLSTGVVPDPFVRSFLRTQIGIAETHDLDIPLGVVDGDTLFASRGSLLFANLEFEYQQTIRDWIAFRVQFGLLGRLGTGTSALIASGVSATTGFELGWLVRLLEGDRDYLSLSFDVQNSSFTTINIADFVQDIVDGEEAELVRKTPSMRVGGGLRYAHAFSPLFGGMAYAETGWGESVDRRSQDEWFLRFGLSVDADLAAVGWLPIGLALGYDQDSFPEGGADITDVTRAINLRIGYTGRPDLALGLIANYTTFPTRQLEERIHTVSLNFEFRYYF